MNSLPATVGDIYRYVVGVDTHAATHSYAIIEAPSGGLIDHNTFPTSPAGLRRALASLFHPAGEPGPVRRY